MLDKRDKGVSAKIYTRNISYQLTLDFEKHNAQYAPIERKYIKLKSVIRLFHAYRTFFLLSFLPIFSYNGPPLRLQTDKKSNQK